MSTYKKKPDLFETEKGAEILRALQAMAADASYNTEPGYSSNTALYPDNLRPFIAKQMEYLRNHPETDLQHYMSNLRLMTRVK